MTYNDPLEIIEAFGYDPAFGQREWIDGHHIADLRALAQALYFAQRGPVSWGERSTHGDLFGADFERLRRELMIEHRHVMPCRAVEPSFFSWRPPCEYILHKIISFLTQDLPSQFSSAPLKVTYDERGRHAILKEDDDLRDFEVLKLPLYLEFLSAEQIKGDLMRFLLMAVARAEEGRLCGFDGYRALFSHAVHYVDVLWGSTPRH